MERSSQNILIAGIGGQGVNSLSSVIQKILLANGTFCKGAIFKGGAQKRGTVYSTIRIFKSEEVGQHMSSTIPTGELHTLLALEATESLRYSSLFSPDTSMLVNNFSFDFYNERQTGGAKKVDVQKALKTNFINSHLIDFSAQSTALFGDDSMINILLGLEAIKHNILPIDPIEFLDEFQQKTKINYEKMMILMDLCDI